MIYLECFDSLQIHFYPCLSVLSVAKFFFLFSYLCFLLKIIMKREFKKEISTYEESYNYYYQLFFVSINIWK